jgi:serpin B
MPGRGFATSNRGGLRSMLTLAAAALIVAGCASTAATASPKQSQAASPSVAESPSPEASPTTWPSGQVVEYDIVKGQAKLANPAADKGATAGARIDGFAFDLLARLDSEGNLCLSPTSVALALAMVRPGAHGNTASEMDAVLRQFGADGQESQIVALMNQLRGQTVYVDAEGLPLQPGDTPDPAQPDPVLLLTIANQLFSQKDMPVEQAYLDALSSTYDAGVGQLDFMNDPESARLTINKWANDNTKGRIPNVLQPGDITPYTRIALANAIYLKANWRDKFDPKNTAPADFTTAAGTKVSVPTMSNELRLNYVAGQGYRAVDVPLEMLSTLTMTFIVPDDMAAFQSTLTAAEFDSILSSMKTYDVSLWLPKLSVESRFDLANVLKAMGMKDLFDPNAADLSGITTAEKLFVKQVIHQANMDVDEEGVTAAAVTVVLGLGLAAEPPPHVDFRIDKPFLYFIRDRQSGAILFMGRVNDASAKN